MRDDNISQRIARLKKDVATLKSRQLSGYDVNNIYETDTGNVIDYTWATPIAHFDSIQRWFKFTSDNQKNPFVKLVLDCTDDTSGNHTDPNLLRISIQNQNTLAGATDQEQVYLVEITTNDDTPLQPPPSDDINVKGYVYASDSGTLTVHTSMP